MVLSSYVEFMALSFVFRFRANSFSPHWPEGTVSIVAAA